MDKDFLNQEDEINEDDNEPLVSSAANYRAVNRAV
jgi:hypothetical protein